MKSFSILLSILVTHAFLSTCNTTYRGRHPIFECQHRKLDSGEKCNVSTNCKYGGKCQKVAGLRRKTTSIRFVVPSIEPRNIIDTELSQEILTSITEQISTQGGGWEAEECVCDFVCVEDSRTEMEVCASNGRTYMTECHMERDACLCQSDIVFVHKGPCQRSFHDKQDHGLKNDEPSRIFAVGDCTTGCRYGAACDEETGRCICNVECTTQPVSHVCGRDGRTYTNLCHVKQAQCRYQRGIDVLHRRPCRRDQIRATVPSPGKCDRMFCNASVSDPVCGTDDVSYENECVMKKASCRKGRRVKVKHKHSCGQSVTDQTTSIKSKTSHAIEDGLCDGISCHYGGVCINHEKYLFICSCEAICNEGGPKHGNENAYTVEPEIVTHDNEREAKHTWREQREENTYGRKRRINDRTSRRRRQRVRSRRSIKGSRELIYEVLCGTDNMTYSNECQMKIHACHEQKEIEIAHKGACVRPVISQSNHPLPHKVPVEESHLAITIIEDSDISDSTNKHNSLPNSSDLSSTKLPQYKGPDDTTKIEDSDSPKETDTHPSSSVLTEHIRDHKVLESGTPTPATRSSPKNDVVSRLGEKRSSFTSASHISLKTTNEYDDKPHETIEKAPHTERNDVKISPSEKSMIEGVIASANGSLEVTSRHRNVSGTSKKIASAIGNKGMDDEKTNFSSQIGNNVLGFTLGSAFGLLLIMAISLAIFLFLRKSKKMKELTQIQNIPAGKVAEKTKQGENDNPEPKKDCEV